MKAVGWNNGQFHRTGAGYGIRISSEDRDINFSREWNHVVIELEGEEETVTVSISPSFWKKCPELRSAKIGKWMIKNDFRRWPPNNPPTFELKPIREQRFRLVVPRRV